MKGHSDELPRNLQYLRAQRNMPQEQLAMLLGVSRQAISNGNPRRPIPRWTSCL